jgi:hypothetical protein
MMMPQVVIIDPKGMIRAKFAGDDLTFADSIQETTLRDKLDEIVKGQAAPKKPPVPSAKKAPAKTQ